MKTFDVRKMVLTAMLAALASVIMFISFPVPLMPGFISMDFSELPALVASFTMGPVAGVAVCLVKNLVNLPFSHTGGVGELSNFMLGCFFVIPAGLIYRKWRKKSGAVAGAVVGAASMAVLSVFTNYFIVYPVYMKIMPIEAIFAAYQAINPNVTNLWQMLLLFNMPFTFIKGMASALIIFAIYQLISPLWKKRF